MMTALLLTAAPFIHPGIAGAALLAGLIPILVHLINRRRFVRVPWAAMSFLLAANRRSARRIRLEQSLLLMVRVALIVLLGLAVARPYLAASPLLPMGLGSSVHRVLLVDNSLSMSATTPDGTTRFNVARRCAERLLSSFPHKDTVSVVTLAQPAEAVIAQGSYDRRFVRQRLASIGPSQRATDTAGGLAAAVEILKASDAPIGNRAVYLISDLPRRVWESESPETPTAAVRALRQLADALVDAAVDLTVVHAGRVVEDNVAITGLTEESVLAGVAAPVRIVAEVVNFGSSSARDLSIQIRRDGQIIRRQELPRLGPGESTVTTITTEFPSAGTHLIEARLSAGQEDALQDDNIRYLSLEVRDTRPVLLVDGRAGPTSLAGQVGFLATALSPGRRAGGWDEDRLGSPITPKVITGSELTGEVLRDYDALVLCNVQRLSADAWSRLETFVADGRGLMIFSGDLVSVDNYNRYGHAEGAGLLPGRISRPVTPPPDAETHLGFMLDDTVHPIVAEFANHPESGLFTSRVERYQPIEVDSRRAEVILRYTNGDPALLATTFGKGPVLLCTTTANMDWNNLAAKGDYVSLTLNAMAFLSPRHGDHRNILVGGMIREPLTPAQSSWPLRVTTSDGTTAEPSLAPEHEGLAMTYGPVEKTHALTASIGPEARVFAVNVDPAESDLASVDEQVFLSALDREVRMINDPSAIADEPAVARSTELASFMLYLVVSLLFVEMWMAMRFGSQRAVPRASCR